MKGMRNCSYYFVKGISSIQIIIPVLTLIFVSIVSYKALTHKSRIDTYEEYFLTIESKESENVNLNYDSTLIANKYKDNFEYSKNHPNNLIL